MPDYSMKWEPLNGDDEFLFVAPYKESYYGDPDRFSFKIPTGDTPGDGEASAEGSAEPRIVTVGGLLTGADETEFLDRWDTMCAGIRGGVIGRLYKSTERFLVCQMTSMQRPRDTGITFFDWEIAFRASDPLYYSATLFDEDLELSGDTVIAIGGTYPAVPNFEITVSDIGTGGTITVESTTGSITTTFVLIPTNTGVYTIDNALGTVLRDGTDAVSDFSGEFVESAGPGSTTISITLDNGAEITDAVIQWRKRYSGA